MIAAIVYIVVVTAIVATIVAGGMAVVGHGGEEEIMTCNQFYDAHEYRGEAVILRHDGDGAKALWLHRLTNGEVCMDDVHTCPGVGVGRRSVELLTANWKRCVEWDRET